MKIATFYREWVLLLSTLAMVTAAPGLTRKENVFAYGIWSHKKDVVVLAQVYPCFPEQQLAPPGAAQLFVSRDGGARWEKSGAPLEGREFDYVHEDEGRLWIVGEYTAEGPASETFILVPAQNNLSWTRHVIYEGNSELEGITISRTGDFIAWIRHLKLDNNGWTGPMYVHESRNRGRTWRVLGRTRRGREGPGNGFKKIETERSIWRVTRQAGGGSAIEHRANDKSWWNVVAAFPETCGR